MKELAKALLAAHSAMPVIENNAVNPHYRSNYATLDTIIKQCRPVFTENGIVILEYIDAETTQNLRIIHAESGEFQDSFVHLTCKDPSNPQQLKSAQTYARRMLWLTAAGVCPVDEDDDANKASEGPNPLDILKPYETQIIAYAASKGKIIAGVHELSSQQLADPQGLIKRAKEYEAQNTEVKS